MFGVAEYLYRGSTPTWSGVGPGRRGLRLGRIRAVGYGPDGYLYVATSNRDSDGEPNARPDRLYRIMIGP